jgi:hypothetical protein
MKFFKTGMLAFIVTLFLITGAMAGDGSWTNNAVKSYSNYNEIIRFTCTVDSLDTLTSSAFQLGKYDHLSWTSLPFSLTYQATSTAGTPKLTIYVQGSMDGTTYAAVDTICTDYVAETLTKTTLDLNNIKYAYYKIIVYGVALNNSDTAFDMRLLLYQANY